MPETLPASSLVAVPGRRRITIEVARDAGRRGFSGLYVPSMIPTCIADDIEAAKTVNRAWLAAPLKPIGKQMLVHARPRR